MEGSAVKIGSVHPLLCFEYKAGGGSITEDPCQGVPLNNQVMRQTYSEDLTATAGRRWLRGWGERDLKRDRDRERGLGLGQRRTERGKEKNKGRGGAGKHVETEGQNKERKKGRE